MKESRPILVVDDDEDIREMVSLTLAWRGLNVRSAADGREALTLLRNGVLPALILLDLMMPGMSGTQLVERLRAEGLAQGVPLVILSGDGSARHLAGSLGAVACLIKPVDLEDLVAVVRRLALR